MRAKIQDEFTHLPLSRQRKYQLRMQRDACCPECGEPAIAGSRCLKHLVIARERQRKKRGLKRRYQNTLSYRLQQGLEVPGVRAATPPKPSQPAVTPKTATRSIPPKVAKSQAKPRAAKSSTGRRKA
jgi:hypothetical protein